jgi:uncharacterized membrane protein (UPF0182 family)
MSRPRRNLPHNSKGRRWIPTLVLLAVLLFIFPSIAAGLYVDKLWFESLGFESVFWYGIKARGLLFLVLLGATASALWLGLRMVIAVAGNAKRLLVEIGGRLLEPLSLETVKRIANWFSLTFALIIAAIMSSQWLVVAQYLNRPAANDVVDPIFGRSLNFYLFALPAISVALAWLMLVAIVIVIAAVLMYGSGVTVKLRGLSLAASVLLVAIALRTLVSRYQLLLDDHGLFTGIRYVDDKVYALSLLATAVSLVIAAVVMTLNGSDRIRNAVLPLALPVGVHILGGVLIPGYVTTFVVRPNELQAETPYIRHNIAFTRKAFGLDRVEEMPFEPRRANAVFDPATHATTLSNMRLWDWKALQDTLRQVQVIRTYYDFADVDIDRYTVDGKLTSTMLASREMDLEKLPAGTRNWVNDRLIYTHGYGITMNAASRFTPDGLPDFLLSNMPVDSSFPGIQVKRPEIYFGELTNWPVYVKTRQKEFNYPEGDTNNYSTYEGSGGIRMGSLLRRLLLATEVGDLSAVPFSNDIGPDSVLLLHRNVVDRVSKLAPFLTFDDDPYMVIGDDGALYWMLDAYTTSNGYPYSRHMLVGRRSLNYIRNSVKAVIDAYNGKVTFYIFEDTDPLINAYQKIYPELFRPKTEMPDFLVRHVRYPELLFQTQALMYSSYHVDDEKVFYSREDVWSVAQQTRAQNDGQSAERIDPAYVLMTFPGESKLEFVSILSFTPSKRNNMIGWLAGRSDGDAYGTLRAYHLPKTRFVDGPLQIQARIDQDPQLSSQLTLWNQQGSKVVRGNLLVIPIDDVLLYAEPIYLQAERSPMPALRLIVLATQDRLAYATTFNEALRLLLENRGGSAAQSQNGAVITETAAGAATGSLISRANQALTDYRRLTSEGKLGEAGAKLEELKEILEELNRTK